MTWRMTAKACWPTPRSVTISPGQESGVLDLAFLRLGILLLHANALRSSLLESCVLAAETFELTHQFKRVRRQLKFRRTRLGRIIRDIRRKIDGDAALRPAARLSAAGAQPGSASARSKGLCVTCPGG